ncbi:DUF456 domain-containing protein [Nocardioides donggukensis]|uniref:DUF456 domain-containing protein n=1 Tax=Nocardioides donggukensis TaxID=2774019 RepID=A0A927K8L4_9ACTN|nr:DUF456 domain-containing protein [Nocardioides donggukensis]MBD8869650.1 DUF456 domain-containing protein [Nocardioides donggukensis]
MTLLDLLTGLAIVVGLVGILLPVLPGTALILAAVLTWAVLVGEPAGWVVLAVATTFLAVGTVVKYAVPGRRMQAAGVPGSTLLTGGLLGIVGFFVIPVLGLVLGFVGGVYLAEVRRVGDAAARGTTLTALKAVGLSMLIELAAGLLAAVTWGVGAVVV